MAKKESKFINRLNEIRKLPKIKMPKLKLDDIDRIEELRMDFDKYVQNFPIGTKKAITMREATLLRSRSS